MYILISKLRKRLKAADENHGQLFENIPAPMFIYDASTYKFLAANKAAVLQHRYTKEELLTLKNGLRQRISSLHTGCTRTNLANRFMFVFIPAILFLTASRPLAFKEKKSELTTNTSEIKNTSIPQLA
jgi:hypothetical protein